MYICMHHKFHIFLLLLLLLLIIVYCKSVISLIFVVVDNNFDMI